MREKPRLLFDVDGVLSHGFTEMMCDVLTKLLGRPCRFEDVNQWDIIHTFDAQEVEDEAFAEMKKQGVCRAFQPNPGSQELIAWCQEGADVYAVTSPLSGIYWPSERESWLVDLYKFHHHRVAQIHDKFIVDGDAFIEDKTKNLIDWSKEHPEALPILMRIGPNRNDVWHGLEARNYNELKSFLRHLHGRTLPR